MKRFHEIPDAAVILSSKGVHRQVKAFRRGADIYAAQGSGFVKLGSAGATGIPTLTWHEIEGDGIEYRPNGTRPIWTGEIEE